MNTTPGSHVDRLLTASLVVAPGLYLVANVLHALRGWDSDSAGGVFHVLGARVHARPGAVATWASDGFAAALLLVGSIGVAGNVAYGFDSIHVALGDAPLIDQGGAAVLIKPLGLAFPLMMLMCAVALRAVAPRWVVLLIGFGGLAFPVANVGNIPLLGVAVSITAVVGFGALAVQRTPAALAEPALG